MKLLKFFNLLNIESFTIIFFFLEKKLGCQQVRTYVRRSKLFNPHFQHVAGQVRDKPKRAEPDCIATFNQN